MLVACGRCIPDLDLRWEIRQYRDGSFRVTRLPRPTEVTRHFTRIELEDTDICRHGGLMVVTSWIRDVLEREEDRAHGF